MNDLLRGAVPSALLVLGIAACTVTTDDPEVTPTDDAGASDARDDGHADHDAGDGGHGACPHTEHAWSYEESESTGPVHWKDLKGSDGKLLYEACGGTYDGGAIQQSPIALTTMGLDAGAAPFELGLGAELAWTASAPVTSLWNNGHTWQAGFGGLPLALTANGGTVYALRQAHFHAPAEHAIDGKEHPLEMHFVHVAPGGNAFEAAPFAAVVGVMFDEDPTGKDNAELAKIWDKFAACEQEKDEPVEGITLDLTALLPADRTYVRYDGSLTTPPCSVTVRFHVLTTPLLASKKQIDALTKAVGRNDRPHQPLLGTTSVTLHEQAE